MTEAENVVEPEDAIPEGVRIRHFHDETGRLVETIATLLADEEGKVLFVAHAYCGRKDTPSKELGRTIAIRRLQTFLANPARHNRHVEIEEREAFISNLRSRVARTAALREAHERLNRARRMGE